MTPAQRDERCLNVHDATQCFEDLLADSIERDAITRVMAVANPTRVRFEMTEAEREYESYLNINTPGDHT